MPKNSLTSVIPSQLFVKEQTAEECLKIATILTIGRMLRESQDPKWRRFTAEEILDHIRKFCKGTEDPKITAAYLWKTLDEMSKAGLFEPDDYQGPYAHAFTPKEEFFTWLEEHMRE
ncbi:MAG: hypothetical protein HGA38_02315 [Candidatus Moranbacteria bacterium]|nr:hypothetical protein [Candidatus Moranbacteria bacterium]